MDDPKIPTEETSSDNTYANALRRMHQSFFRLSDGFDALIKGEINQHNFAAMVDIHKHNAITAFRAAPQSIDPVEFKHLMNHIKMGETLERAFDMMSTTPDLFKDEETQRYLSELSQLGKAASDEIKKLYPE